MVEFIKSSSQEDNWLDHPYNEIAFIGRSNVGKSTLLNAIFNQKIAFTSKRPGRTKLINFFKFNNLIITDLPGYGYAALSKKEQNQVINLTWEYLAKRKNLSYLCLLIDGRIGITTIDYNFINTLEQLERKFVLVVNKIDGATQSQLHQTKKAVSQLNCQVFYLSGKKQQNLKPFLKWIAHFN